MYELIATGLACWALGVFTGHAVGYAKGKASMVRERIARHDH